MPSRDVSGLLLPVKVAHHPALELCNTRAWWGSEEPKEYLLTWTHVEVLAADLGITAAASVHGPDEGPEVEGGMLERVLDLRSDLYATITDIAPAWRLTRLDAAIRAGRRDLEFRGMTGGSPIWLSRSTGTSLQTFYDFARAAGNLLERPRRIGACPRCGWVFLDPSGRRKWCAMKWCGNRDKVQQHALRLKSGTSLEGP